MSRAEKVFDNLQMVLGVPAEIGMVVFGPAPRRRLGADEAAADGKDSRVDLGRVIAGDLVVDVGEVPFEGPQACRLEVKETNGPAPHDLISAVRGTMNRKL
jgi:hypothetical protein